MFDPTNGKELPPMQDWTPAQIEEAIRCRVQFEVLALGQGSVIGRLVKANPKARMAVIQVTHDPRGWMEGVEYPTEMRYIDKIPYLEPKFSLTRPANLKAGHASTRAAAKRVIAHARKEAAQQEAATAKEPAAAPAAQEARMAARVKPGDPRLSPMRRRVLRVREG